VRQRPALTTPTLSELAAASAKIGVLGFGGPAGQIALMHKIFVDEKKWVDEDRYLYALSYCTLLPGPEAQQLATYIGWLLHGVRGGLIAGTLFVVPGALIMLALSWLYMTSAEMPLVASALYGLRCVVLALIVQSLIKIGAKSLKLTWTKWMAGISFLALVVLHVPFPVVILVAGLVGWGIERQNKNKIAPAASSVATNDSQRSFNAAFIWVGAWLGPVIALSLLPSAQPILGQIGRLFSGLSLVTFGGAYAATAWLNQQAVSVQNWLSATQMIDGLALVQAIPGPLVLVNQYVGFVAGWNAGGIGLALAGGLLASWCTFAPSFVWIFAGAPFAEKLRDNQSVASALKGVSAAVGGVIASLAVWFGAKVVFGGETMDWRAIDWKAVVMILAAFGILTRTKLGLFPLLVLGALAGILVGTIG
jgi:chromate transporter